MEAKFIWANLVSNDLEKTTKFYTKLGFTANGNYKENEGQAFSLGKTNSLSTSLQNKD